MQLATKQMIKKERQFLFFQVLFPEFKLIQNDNSTLIMKFTLKYNAY